jgi:septum formation protein
MERIVLASNSSRRKELLESAGIGFDCYAPETDETIRDGLAPADRVLALAEDKARAVISSAQLGALRLILAADTLVCVPGAVDGGGELALGKPEDRDDARRMMRLLSGRSHMVRTGIVLLDRLSGELRSSRSDSAVTFAPMGESEIDEYLDSGEWEGVAGAYRIQGLAACFIDRLEGSWTGVVGLPMRELYVILLAAGYRFQARETFDDASIGAGKGRPTAR